MRIDEIITEDLKKWFKEKWVRFGPDGKIRGACARGKDSEGKPKCLPQSKAHALGKKGRAAAARRKRREDPNPERRGKAKNVATKKKTNEVVSHDNLREIGYAHELGDLSLTDQQIIQKSKVDGQIGQRDVMKMIKGNNVIYYFSDGDRIDALLLLDGDRLAAIKNFTSNKGLIHALFNYVINIKRKKLKINPDDSLTPYGIEWALKQIDRKDGFKITDLDGNPIDADQLKAEWNKSRLDPEKSPGTTGLIIGESGIAQKLRDNEKSLMPYDIFGVKEQLDEKWSKKYKRSIDCSHPKGFSQKAHCAGRKKHEESREMCPECGGEMYPDTMINEKKDACYYKVKSRYKVWPSAYASGALVKCRKKGAKNWGNKSK